MISLLCEWRGNGGSYCCCFLCVSVSSSSLGCTPTTRCSRPTTATVIWASRRRTWAAAGWSNTSCGGRTFLWGQYSPVRHLTALLWRSYSAADRRDVSRRRPHQVLWTKMWFFLIVQHRDIFHRVHRHPSSRMCHFHLPSYPRNFCF